MGTSPSRFGFTPTSIAFVSSTPTSGIGWGPRTPPAPPLVRDLDDEPVPGPRLKPRRGRLHDEVRVLVLDEGLDLESGRDLRLLHEDVRKREVVRGDRALRLLEDVLRVVDVRPDPLRGFQDRRQTAHLPAVLRHHVLPAALLEHAPRLRDDLRHRVEVLLLLKPPRILEELDRL